MFRILNAVSLIALLAAAGAVYHVKYSAAFEAQEIARLRTEIRTERDRIAVLHAEWARRTAPDRIQALAERHLDMEPLTVDNMDRLASLPAKPEGNGDLLGGMIEALVDGPSLKPATPAVLSKPAARAPSNRLPDDAPLAEVPMSGDHLTVEPLSLSSMPAAGNMAPPRPALAGPQGVIGAPLDPIGGAPLLPPASVGR